MATTTITPEMEAMSLDDLRKAAEEEARKQSTGTQTTEEEEKETTTTTEEVEEVEEEVEAPKQFFAERSFDLGDGAGSQVYKGKGTSREEALEDLSNKLIEAQKNATKRIKELKTPNPEVSKEDEALLAAELVQTPSATIRKILKASGVDLDEVKESTNFVKTQKETSTKKKTADSFVASHADYADTAHNGKLINKWCELHNDFSLEGMNKAYQDLNESGLLQVKGEEAGHAQEENKSETRTEVKTEVTPSRVTRKASGLSTHRRTPVPVVTELSEDEMAALPLDEIRKRANKQLAGNR